MIIRLRPYKRATDVTFIKSMSKPPLKYMCEKHFKIYWWALQEKKYVAFTGNSHSILCKRVTETNCSDIFKLFGGVESGNPEI